MAKKKKPNYGPQKRWKKENMKTISFRLSRINEAEIIQRLESQKSKKAYIVQLIRDDMRRDDNN